MKTFFALIFIFLFSLTVNAQRKIEVSGRIIDEKGQPVINARVTWVYEPEFQFVGGRAYESYLTMEDGYFGFVAEWKPKKKIRIFIEESTANPRFCVIDFLDFKDKRFDYIPHSQGLLISKYKPEISLGNISNYIKYGLVRINLADADKSFIEDIKNRLVYLQVRDIKGNLLSNSSINPAYSEANKSLKICLPIGRWKLEIYRAGQEVKLKPSTLVDVSEVNDEIELILD
jgi:hypothetical protein